MQYPNVHNVALVSACADAGGAREAAWRTEFDQCPIRGCAALLIGVRLKCLCPKFKSIAVLPAELDRRELVPCERRVVRLSYRQFPGTTFGNARLGA